MVWVAAVSSLLVNKVLLLLVYYLTVCPLFQRQNGQHSNTTTAGMTEANLAL
jgi:hypothetical protein